MSLDDRRHHGYVHTSHSNGGVNACQNGQTVRHRKTTAPTSRKGLLAGCNPYQLIEDEEYLLNQTVAKPKLLSTTGEVLNCVKLESLNVRRWFNCEYFYSSVDKAYFSSTDIS